MDSKDPKPWDDADEVETVELKHIPGGAADTKSIPSQDGGDERPPQDDSGDSEEQPQRTTDLG